jgi:hypothetical protein
MPLQGCFQWPFWEVLQRAIAMPHLNSIWSAFQLCITAPHFDRTSPIACPFLTDAHISKQADMFCVLLGFVEYLDLPQGGAFPLYVFRNVDLAASRGCETGPCLHPGIFVIRPGVDYPPGCLLPHEIDITGPLFPMKDS